MLLRNENNGLPNVFNDNDNNEEDQRVAPSGLGDLLEFSSTEEKWRTTFINYNCGNVTFGLSMTAKDFYDNSRIANQTGDNEGGIAQRALNSTHAKALGAFLFKGLVNSAIVSAQMKGEEPGAGLLEIQDVIGKSVYVGIQPVTCNIRDIKKGAASFQGYRIKDPNSSETACFRAAFLPKHTLYVVDGQHRREGFRYVFEFIKSVLSTGKIGKQANLIPSTSVVGDISDSWMRGFQAIDQAAIAHATVLIEAHLGLSLEEERQLFSDLNSRGLNVSANLTLAFDGSNPVNEYVKKHTGSGGLIRLPVIETEKGADVTVADGAILRKDLVAVNAQLFLNSSSIKTATNEKVQSREAVADRFWEQVCKIPGIGEPGLSKRSVLSQPVVLKAMAKLCYALTPKKDTDSSDVLDRYLSELPRINFSHDNPVWRFDSLIKRDFSVEGVDVTGLEEYTAFQTSKGAQRGLGIYKKDSSIFEFATRANDVMPVLGDILRHEMGLPNRHVKK